MNLEDWRARVLKKYSFVSFLRNELRDVSVFPLRVDLKKIAGRELIEDYSAYRRISESMTAECQKLGIGVEFGQFQHRTLGSQSVPQALTFENSETYLRFIKKARENAIFRQASESILSVIPELKNFFVKRPLLLLEFPGSWARIATVCRFFGESPRPGVFLRQLELSEVDTKFIEAHKKVIIQLVHALRQGEGQEELFLPNVDNFEESLGLIKEAPRLRFRILGGGENSVFAGLVDIETPLPALLEREIPCETVFIVENKVTGLCLPPCDNAIVFFELGYKVALLGQIEWLKRRRLIYWGDLDTHGFAILARLREYFPHVQSVLMDEATLLSHKDLWTREERPFTGECAALTPAESEVFRGLQQNRWGIQVRLEQERVRLSKWTEVLRSNCHINLEKISAEK